METKYCGKCEQEKDVSLFSKDSRSKSGLQSKCKQCNREYRALNKDRIKQYKNDYYVTNKELISSQHKERYQNDNCFRKKKVEYAREYSKRNDVKIKERLRASKRRTEEGYKALNAHYQKKRHAAKLNRTPSWANEQLIAAYYKEAKRLQELTGIEFHVDHIIPLQGELVSGLHVASNLQLLMAHENLGKSNKFDPEEFCA